MPTSLSARLSLMMFLNYVVWGAWYVTLGTYLTTTLKFSGTEAGAVFGTTALACMISPFFVGLVADRYFSTERVLAALHLLGGLFLYLAAQATSFGAVYMLLLLHCLCYFPTISLTNSLTLRQLTDAGSQFPLIRVFATLGWIAVGQVVGNMGVEATATPFLIAAGCSVVMSLYCLTLPHTPPAGTGTAVTFRSVLGLDALVMLRDRSYLVFVIASVLACIPLTFYFSFTNAFLNEAGVRNAAGEDDARPSVRGHHDAADAADFPAIQPEVDLAGGGCSRGRHDICCSLTAMRGMASGCSMRRFCCTVFATTSSL